MRSDRTNSKTKSRKGIVRVLVLGALCLVAFVGIVSVQERVGELEAFALQERECRIPVCPLFYCGVNCLNDPSGCIDCTFNEAVLFTFERSLALQQLGFAPWQAKYEKCGLSHFADCESVPQCQTKQEATARARVRLRNDAGC